ncbi:MAG: polyprenyl synthetase family protein [Verrucomicrobiales bacterium]
MFSVSAPHQEEYARLRELVDQTCIELFEQHWSSKEKLGLYSILLKDVKNFVVRPGKRLRPVLFLFACKLFDKNISPDHPSLLRVAAALEMLHAFILIHDDIIDQSDLRRGQPSLHRQTEERLIPLGDRRQGGLSLALVMGDVLFALSQEVLLDSKLDSEILLQLSRQALQCMMETGIGEAADVVYGTRDITKVNLEEIERMYALKTTRYTFQAPFKLAAIVARAPQESLNCVLRLLEPLGLAFQIQNDLKEFLDYDTSYGLAPSDIVEGKKTVLMRLAYEKLNDTDRGLLQLCLSTRPPTEATVTRLRQLVMKSGAVEELSQRVQNLFQSALNGISECGLSQDQSESLSQLLGSIQHLVCPSLSQDNNL